MCIIITLDNLDLSKCDLLGQLHSEIITCDHRVTVCRISLSYIVMYACAFITVDCIIFVSIIVNSPTFCCTDHFFCKRICRSGLQVYFELTHRRPFTRSSHSRALITNRRNVLDFKSCHINFRSIWSVFFSVF